MQSIRVFITQYDRRDASDVRLVIHTPRLYVALHTFERYTAQKLKCTQTTQTLKKLPKRLNPAFRLKK